MNLVKGAVLLAVLAVCLVLNVTAEDDAVDMFRKAINLGDHDEAVRLVRVGLVRTDQEFKDGGTPLCDAARDESADGFDVVLELVTNGARPNQRCEGGFRPLHFAAEAGNLAVADLLVRNGANVSVEGPERYITPLYKALSEGHARVASYLERHGATIPNELRASVEPVGRVTRALEEIGSSPFPPDSPEDDQWQALMAIEIYETYEEGQADPVVARTMAELRNLLKTNPKPETMSNIEWMRIQGEAAKAIALREVR